MNQLIPGVLERRCDLPTRCLSVYSTHQWVHAGGIRQCGSLSLKMALVSAPFAATAHRCIVTETDATWHGSRLRDVLYRAAFSPNPL